MRRVALFAMLVLLRAAASFNSFVVGASRGIGYEVAKYLATNMSSPGDVVHATARRLPVSIDAAAGRMVWHTLEVTNQTQIAELAASDVARHGSIDMLIHVAGVNKGSQEEQLAVNAIAPFRIVNALLPAVLRSQSKRICIVTSDRGTKYYVQRFQRRFKKRCKDVAYCAYAVSKAAAHDTFRSVEPEWRKQGIRAIVLHPGGVATDMNKRQGPITAEIRAPDVARVCAAATADEAGRLLNWQHEVMKW